MQLPSSISMKYKWWIFVDVYHYCVTSVLDFTLCASHYISQQASSGFEHSSQYNYEKSPVVKAIVCVF